MKRATRTQHDAILRRLERGREAHRHDTEVRLINAIVAQTGADWRHAERGRHRSAPHIGKRGEGDGMTTYVVLWGIEIDADSPQEAARIALDIQRDPGSLATVFDVIPYLASGKLSKRYYRIDLAVGGEA